MELTANLSSDKLERFNGIRSRRITFLHFLREIRINLNTFSVFSMPIISLGWQSQCSQRHTHKIHMYNNFFTQRTLQLNATHNRAEANISINCIGERFPLTLYALLFLAISFSLYLFQVFLISQQVGSNKRGEARYYISCTVSIELRAK